MAVEQPGPSRRVSPRRLAVLGLLLALVVTVSLLIPAIPDEVDFTKHERKIFSQNGEDGVIEKIFEIIEPTSKFCIEFGAGDGVKFSNVRNLIINKGWRSLMIEGDEGLTAKCQKEYKEFTDTKCLHHWVYPGNVETIFEEHGVPQDVDFMVIDIDSFDYYVWKVMHRFRPKVVMIEVNGHFVPPIKAVVRYSPFLFWDHTFYYGASVQSLYELGKSKGYELIYMEKKGINVFFVDEKYFARFGILDNSPKRLYQVDDSKIQITEQRLPQVIDDNGFVRPGIPNRIFNNKLIEWDAMTLEKRWIMGR